MSIFKKQKIFLSIFKKIQYYIYGFIQYSASSCELTTTFLKIYFPLFMYFLIV